MPNRLLREGITTSDRLDALSPEAEVTFYRLLVVCDDFGRMDARLPIIKAHCFPLKAAATLANLEKWLSELASQSLIVRYTHDGKPLLAVNKWEQRQRSRPKYAGPEEGECLTNVRQLSDICPAIDGLGKGKGKGKGKGATSRTSRELRTFPPEWMPSDNTTEHLVREYSLTPEDVVRYVDAFRDRCLAKGYRYADWDAAFRNCVKDDWPQYRANGAGIRMRPRSIV